MKPTFFKLPQLLRLFFLTAPVVPLSAVAQCPAIEAVAGTSTVSFSTPEFRMKVEFLPANAEGFREGRIAMILPGGESVTGKTVLSAGEFSYLEATPPVTDADLAVCSSDLPECVTPEPVISAVEIHQYVLQNGSAKFLIRLRDKHSAGFILTGGDEAVDAGCVENNDTFVGAFEEELGIENLYETPTHISESFCPNQPERPILLGNDSDAGVTTASGSTKPADDGPDHRDPSGKGVREGSSNDTPVFEEPACLLPFLYNPNLARFDTGVVTSFENADALRRIREIFAEIDPSERQESDRHLLRRIARIIKRISTNIVVTDASSRNHKLEKAKRNVERLRRLTLSTKQRKELVARTASLLERVRLG